MAGVTKGYKKGFIPIEELEHIINMLNQMTHADVDRLKEEQVYKLTSGCLRTLSELEIIKFARLKQSRSGHKHGGDRRG